MPKRFARPRFPQAVLTGPPRTMEEVERLYVRHVLGLLEGRRMDAARTLGISYPTFLRRLGEE